MTDVSLSLRLAPSCAWTLVPPAYTEGRVPDWEQPAAFGTCQFLAFRCGHRKGLGQGA